MIKDLSKIGRDLSKVVILDDTPGNFILQKENGISIKSWKGSENDKLFLWLSPVFANIAKLNPPDIREVIMELKDMLVSN